MAAQQGDVLGGRYTLRTRIAGGGMGEVWTATDAILSRTVAVKVVRPGLGDDPAFAARFRTEARIAAGLTHSHIAQVYDFGEGAGTAYLVMEYVAGRSFADLIDRPSPLAPGEAVRLLGQAAEALAAAHESGVIHRDVKPANILITPHGAVKLTDFGIARALGEAKVTRTGEVMGTAQYLAPEAALGRPVTAQTDVYALAVVAYEMLAGRRPFDADSAVSLAMKHVNEPPPPLPPTIPWGLREAVMRGLTKNPEHRPRGAAELARQMREGLSTSGP
ncbi:protein kinase [Luteipulveratus sp. YIM 133132]|uniref:protein kinase domain-containing protein n=1 Tax=Luteipulveratus flavus TaxID=3031728 RepID=UPI0023AFE6F8|nr:protein kinase [Luteipulveratus sp. YIM 133132]MDE9367525.1 protein kinase [Luteipulveratus sp. YIM 133132]